MGIIGEILKTIGKYTKKKIKGGNDEDKRKFKKIFSEEMKKRNKNHNLIYINLAEFIFTLVFSKCIINCVL